MSWQSLLRGELILTLNIIAGLAFGMAVLRCGVASRLLRLFAPLLSRLGIAPVLGLALGVSIGSSRAGTSLLAASFDEGQISERTAKWGTLMLAFPAYLHRWPSTLILSAGMTGVPGVIFASVLLLRSAARFIALALVLCKEKKRAWSFEAEGGEMANCLKMDAYRNLAKKLIRTLPLAWVFYATALMLVPRAEDFLRSNLGGSSFLPLAGWAVVAASISHVSASLALTGGSLAAGDLTAAQAVFALLLGNGLGVVTRAVRQNAGYYFGLFPKTLARRILFLNVVTQVPFVLITLFFAALPLLYV